MISRNLTPSNFFIIKLPLNLFIILTDNPAIVDVDSLKDIEVLLTMVGGNIEYDWFPIVEEFSHSLQKVLPWLPLISLSGATILR